MHVRWILTLPPVAVRSRPNDFHRHPPARPLRVPHTLGRSRSPSSEDSWFRSDPVCSDITCWKNDQFLVQEIGLLTHPGLGPKWASEDSSCRSQSAHRLARLSRVASATRQPSGGDRLPSMLRPGLPATRKAFPGGPGVARWTLHSRLAFGVLWLSVILTSAAVSLVLFPRPSGSVPITRDDPSEFNTPLVLAEDDVRQPMLPVGFQDGTLEQQLALFSPEPTIPKVLLHLPSSASSAPPANQKVTTAQVSTSPQAPTPLDRLLSDGQIGAIKKRLKL